MQSEHKYKIFTNIPIPEPKPWKMFQKMNVNECILIADKKVWARNITMAHLYGGMVGFKMRCKWDKTERVGRIWRIE